MAKKTNEVEIKKPVERGLKNIFIDGNEYTIGLFKVREGRKVMLKVQKLLMPFAMAAMTADNTLKSQVNAMANALSDIDPDIADSLNDELLSMVLYKGKCVLDIMDAHEPFQKNLNILFQLGAHVIEANGFLDLSQGMAVSQMTGLKSETV